MKNIIILSFTLLFVLPIFAQKKTQAERQAEIDKRKTFVKYEPRDSLNYPVKYCLLLATGKLFSNEVDIQIDYGQDSTFFEDTKIRDKNGLQITFNSVIDALNYMESLGWEFVNAYAITVGPGQDVYHYLLRAGPNIQDDFIPKTKRDFRKNNK